MKKIQIRYYYFAICPNHGDCTLISNNQRAKQEQRKQLVIKRKQSFTKPQYPCAKCISPADQHASDVTFPINSSSDQYQIENENENSDPNPYLLSVQGYSFHPMLIVSVNVRSIRSLTSSQRPTSFIAYGIIDYIYAPDFSSISGSKA